VPWFIKKETLTTAFRALPDPERGTQLQAHRDWVEVGAFYWTALAPEIVNSGKEELGSVSV